MAVKDQFHIPRTITIFKERAFSVADQREWNTLPQNITDIINREAFKRALRHYFKLELPLYLFYLFLISFYFVMSLWTLRVVRSLWTLRVVRSTLRLFSTTRVKFNQTDSTSDEGFRLDIEDKCKWVHGSQTGQV